jgi:hypothetical protein
MRKRLKWFPAVLVALWLAGCSHSPAPATKVAQQPAPQSQPQASPTQGTPIVEVFEVEFDFGTVEEGKDYIHNFKVANKGNGVLEIKKVLPA